jgi:hypothetical protein
VLIGLAGFAVYLVVLACLLRLLMPASKALYVLAVSVVVFFCIVVPASALVQQPVSFWHVLALYWLPCLIFIMGFGPAYKSVSLRVVHDLWLAPGHTLDRNDVTAQLVQSETFLHRVDLLTRDGLVARDGAQLALTERGRRIAGRTTRAQKFFAVEQTG